MRSLIKQSIVLPAPADVLYATYLDPARHAEITGSPVTIGAKPGSPFRAFGGRLRGTTLVAIPSRLIIQSWRSTNFHSDDPDSTLILSFVPLGKAGRIDLLHLDVPDVDYQGVTRGWKKFYWIPWKNYFAKARNGKKVR